MNPQSIPECPFVADKVQSTTAIERDTLRPDLAELRRSRLSAI